MAKRDKRSTAKEPSVSDGPKQMLEYFVAQLAASRVDSAVDEAQDLMFDAWDCEAPKKRIAMARKALKISADCADAYVLLAQEAARSEEEAIRLWREGVAAGERALGPQAFKDDVGMFWGLLETRPYMRARAGLAMALWEAGQADEAVDHAQAMLDLNPNDNQGGRYLLLTWLLGLGRDDEAGRLLRRYKDDGGSEWAWSAALAAFRRQGDHAVARKALTRAIDANPHIAAYLLGRRKPPLWLPDYVETGGEDEAAAYADVATASWSAAPGALAWLEARSDGTPM